MTAATFKRYLFLPAAAAALTLCLLASSCVKTIKSDEGGVCVTMKAKVNLPPEYLEYVSVTQIPVKIESKSLPLSVTSYPNSEGMVTFTVAPGKYDIVASYYDKSTRTAVNGLCNEFLLTENGIASGNGTFIKSEVNIDLSVALPSPIVIRELYFHGSKTLEGGTSYTKDRYVEIYNNNGEGGKNYCLDSLCISTIFPYNSTGGNNAWVGQDTLALAQIYWTIPGNGSTYILKPGESVVIALQSAVDHSERCTSGLPLNKAHFGCYDENLSGHEISAEVTSMICNMVGQGTAWAVSIHSPAFVLFRPPMGVAQYRKQAAIWERYEPGKAAGTKYWHIAKDWIIDGVECYDSPSGALKRLPSSVDASYCCMTLPHYSGHCISRRVDESASTATVTVYQDTNNSLNDFTVDQELAPRLKE